MLTGRNCAPFATPAHLGIDARYPEPRDGVAIILMLSRAHAIYTEACASCSPMPSVVRSTDGPAVATRSRDDLDPARCKCHLKPEFA